MQVYDTIIIGGGPAGLSAAIYLARFNRTVLVIDKHDGRSTFAQKNENYFGFPNGIRARELSARGRKQAQKYGAHITTDEIIDIKKEKEIFILTSKTKEYQSKSVILATGVTDLFPHLGDWKKYVGRSLFWCITCDGYKANGKKIVIIGQDDESVCTALQFLNFTKDITFITNIHKGKETINSIWCRRLKNAGIPYFTQNIQRLYGKRGYVSSIQLEDGTSVEAKMVFNQQGSIPNYELAQKFGIKLTDEKCIIVDAEQRTNIPFVYASGDVTSLHSHQIVTAAHEGSMAAQAANYDLYDDTQRI